MSPASRALIAAFMTLLMGGVLNVLAMHWRWVPRFPRLAAVISPIAIGLLVYFAAP